MITVDKGRYLQLKADLYKSVRNSMRKTLLSGEWVPLIQVWRVIFNGDCIAVYDVIHDNVRMAYINAEENTIAKIDEKTITFVNVCFYKNCANNILKTPQWFLQDPANDQDRLLVNSLSEKVVCTSPLIINPPSDINLFLLTLTRIYTEAAKVICGNQRTDYLVALERLIHAVAKIWSGGSGSRTERATDSVAVAEIVATLWTRLPNVLSGLSEDIGRIIGAGGPVQFMILINDVGMEEDVKQLYDTIQLARQFSCGHVIIIMGGDMSIVQQRLDIYFKHSNRSISGSEWVQRFVPSQHQIRLSLSSN